MERLTPTKFSQVKEMNGANGPFKKVGFLTREHGDKKWFNISFNQENPLKEGQTYELEVKERGYTDKNGNPATSFDAKLPTKESEMSRAIFNLGVEMGKLRDRVTKLETTPKLTPAQMDEPPSDYDQVNEELAGLPVDDSSLPF